MILKSAIILLLLLTYHFASASDTLLDQKRIIGGSIVSSVSSNSLSDINKWPWMVALIDQNNHHFCGASLIDSQWLMTAAHCLYNFTGGRTSNLKITALFKQSDLLDADENTVTREIIATVIHPDYSYSTNNNDIALLKLDSPITDILPVGLPGHYYDSPIRLLWETATVLGWGTTSYVGYQYSLLRQAQLPIADFYDCVDNYKDFGVDINRNMICAGFEKGGVDACTGDSGGPLVIPHESGLGWKQVGIVSFGIGCALPDFFGVYTRVSRYDDFIQSYVCEQQDSAPTLSVQRDELHRTLTLTITSPSALGSDNYRIYYAPYPWPSPILNFELIGTNSITISPVPESKAYYATAQILKSNCSSHFSQLVFIPAF